MPQRREKNERKTPGKTGQSPLFPQAPLGQIPPGGADGT